MDITEYEYYAQDRILRNINREIQIRGIKQEVLAEMIGIRQNHLSEKLNGKNGLKVAFVIRICHALEIPLTDVFVIPTAKS